jgi:hypothetical protein
MAIWKHGTHLRILPALLVIAGCTSWGQDDLESARVAHDEAVRYAELLDDCGTPVVVKSQDAIMRLEAIVYRNQETRWHKIDADPPVTEPDPTKVFEETYPWMFDSKFQLADRLHAEGCEYKARVIYQQIADDYPEALFSSYRERAISALSGAQN